MNEQKLAFREKSLDMIDKNLINVEHVFVRGKVLSIHRGISGNKTCGATLTVTRDSRM